MVNVTVYFKENDSACNDVLNLLDELSHEINFGLVKVDINSDFSIKEKYQNDIPLVVVGPYQLKYPTTKQDLWIAIKAAEDRQGKLEMDKNYQKRLKQGSEITKTDNFSLWLSKYYMLLVNIIIFIYIGLPFLAPVLMKNNMEAPAKVIYTVYSSVCHQLAYRSWFLFGEQVFYPKELAHVDNMKPYENYFGADSSDLSESRQFLGNAVMGYKVAICERDVAIYGSMLLFGLIFMLSGRKIKSIPWYIWILVGMVPMGFDGGSQLLSVVQTFFPKWALARESTPFLRSITGLLFGTMTAWYVFPIIEESMIESRSFVLRKIAVINSYKTNILAEKQA